MVFSSEVFLFAFLPAVLALYSLAPGDRPRNMVLAHRSRDVDEPLDAAGPELAGFARHVTVIDRSTFPKAVIFGDSFSEQIRPFFGESLRRVVNLHHIRPIDPQFDTRFLEREKPDVVIQQLVERGLVSGAEFKP